MIPATIATAVAPETISKVTRLFNNTAFDVINELFQNARRAGAQCVSVSIQTSGADTFLHVVDDETRRAEDPAGMGVFSLAGRNVIIRSYSRPDRQGWMAHIPATAWETSRPIAITSDPIACGTAITVCVPGEWVRTLRDDITRAAKHYPVAVLLDGEALPYEDWLADADHVEEWNGTRIGVFRKNPSH